MASSSFAYLTTNVCVWRQRVVVMASCPAGVSTERSTNSGRCGWDHVATDKGLVVAAMCTAMRMRVHCGWDHVAADTGVSGGCDVHGHGDTRTVRVGPRSNRQGASGSRNVRGHEDTRTLRVGPRSNRQGASGSCDVHGHEGACTYTAEGPAPPGMVVLTPLHGPAHDHQPAKTTQQRTAGSRATPAPLLRYSAGAGGSAGATEPRTTCSPNSRTTSTTLPYTTTTTISTRSPLSCFTRQKASAREQCDAMRVWGRTDRRGGQS